MKSCFVSVFIVLNFLNFSLAQISYKDYKAFSFEKTCTVPGDSLMIFDYLTGDISDWWDHSFKKDPYKLFIEPKPGGAFWEIFNENGDGAKHATVIYAERGKMIRFEGPLGLSGKAIQLVCTYKLSGHGNDSTLFELEVHGAGEFEEDVPEIIEKVWEHFVFDRFVPYVEEKRKTNR